MQNFTLVFEKTLEFLKNHNQCLNYCNANKLPETIEKQVILPIKGVK